MKKIYEKPCAMMEYFKLSQSIAQSCGWNSDGSYGQPTHSDGNTCGWQDAGGDIYWTQAPACTTIVDQDFEIGEGCYNAPSGSSQIFAS